MNICLNLLSYLKDQQATWFFMLVIDLISSFATVWSLVGGLLDGDWFSDGEKARIVHWCLRILVSVGIYYIVAI